MIGLIRANGINYLKQRDQLLRVSIVDQVGLVSDRKQTKVNISIKMEDDILQTIPDEDIPKLRKMYETSLPTGSYIYNYLEAVAKWKAKRPNKNYITVMAPYGNWKLGTFVAVNQYSCYEVVMYTLEDDCQSLCEALSNTKKINWKQRFLLYAVHADHYPKIVNVLRETPLRFHCVTTLNMLWMPQEKALQFDIRCPFDVYIAKLDPSHASTINSHWPHRYKDSDKHIATMIEMNGGYGVFLKANDTLVAWVLRNLLGLGVLQTVEKHKRKGYGSLVTKALSKEIAESGADPLGAVLAENSASHSMFEKLGFEILEQVVTVESES